MAYYRYFQLDSRGHFRAARIIEADDDTGAIGQAEALFLDLRGAGFEVWQGERLVMERRQTSGESAAD